jgi:hypothetical protein
MKNYDVRYWIKANRAEVEYSMIVFAKDAKEACRICKERVKENCGRNAFRPAAKRVEV